MKDKLPQPLAFQSSSSNIVSACLNKSDEQSAPSLIRTPSSFKEWSDERSPSMVVSMPAQPKVIIDELSDGEAKIEEIKVIPPIPKMQSRYKIGQYVLSMSDQKIYIVEEIIENSDKMIVEMILCSVDNQENIQVSIDDSNYQVASADNAIWVASEGLDFYSAECLKTPMMMSIKVAIEEFAQIFSQTTTFLNAGGAITYFFQQFAQIIYEVINGFQVPEDFTILRSLYDEFPSQWKHSAIVAADAIMAAKPAFDHKYKKEMMSTNLSLFGNAGAGGESTGIMYSSNGAGRLSFSIFMDFINHFPFDNQYKDKIIEKTKTLYNTLIGNVDNKMALYQLQIPNDILKEVAYPSLAGGQKLGSFKFGTSLIKILEKLNIVGTALNDKEMLEFVDKAQESLKTSSEESFYANQENFERMNFFVFRASQFPDYWDDQEWRQGTQARVIMYPEYFMNPSSGIKIKIHKSPLLESDESLETELLEIRELSILGALAQINVPIPKDFQTIITDESDSKAEQLNFEQKKVNIEKLWEYYVQKKNEVGDQEYIQLKVNIEELLKKSPPVYSLLYKRILTIYSDDMSVFIKKCKLKSYYEFLIAKLEELKIFSRIYGISEYGYLLEFDYMYFSLQKIVNIDERVKQRKHLEKILSLCLDVHKSTTDSFQILRIKNCLKIELQYFSNQIPNSEEFISKIVKK